MKISIIVAMDEKRGIGKDNDLLFKIPEDFERMKKLTSGHTIIMGRKTYESIGRPLPGRYNIVITRDLGFKIHDLREGENFSIIGSLEEAIQKAKKIQDTKYKTQNTDEIFIFGGGQIFKEALPITDKLYLTIVQGDFHADTFFPDYSEFKKITLEKKGEYEKYRYVFLDLERLG